MEVKYTAWGTSDPSSPSSPSPSSSSSASVTFLKWVVILVTVVNIAVIQVQLGPSKQKLYELTRAVDECQHSPEELSRVLTAEFVERAKKNPPLLPSFAGEAGQQVAKAFSLDFSLEMYQNYIGLFPQNLFETADNIISADFTDLAQSISTFSADLADGVSIVFDKGTSYPDSLMITSALFNIFATQVEPLSDYRITPDPSVVGNFFTLLPGDVQTALSHPYPIDVTSENCVILMSRLYATDWDTSYEHADCNGKFHGREVGPGRPIKVFKTLERACEALNIE